MSLMIGKATSPCWLAPGPAGTRLDSRPRRSPALPLCRGACAGLGPAHPARSAAPSLPPRAPRAAVSCHSAAGAAPAPSAPAMWTFKPWVLLRTCAPFLVANALLLLCLVLASGRGFAASLTGRPGGLPTGAPEARIISRDEKGWGTHHLTLRVVVVQQDEHDNAVPPASRQRSTSVPPARCERPTLPARSLLRSALGLGNAVLRLPVHALDLAVPDQTIVRAASQAPKVTAAERARAAQTPGSSLRTTSSQALPSSSRSSQPQHAFMVATVHWRDASPAPAAGLPSSQDATPHAETPALGGDERSAAADMGWQGSWRDGALMTNARSVAAAAGGAVAAVPERAHIAASEALAQALSFAAVAGGAATAASSQAMTAAGGAGQQAQHAAAGLCANLCTLLGDLTSQMSYVIYKQEGFFAHMCRVVLVIASMSATALLLGGLTAAATECRSRPAAGNRSRAAGVKRKPQVPSVSATSVVTAAATAPPPVPPELRRPAAAALPALQAAAAAPAASPAVCRPAAAAPAAPPAAACALPEVAPWVTSTPASLQLSATSVQLPHLPAAGMQLPSAAGMQLPVADSAPQPVVAPAPLKPAAFKTQMAARRAAVAAAHKLVSWHDLALAPLQSLPAAASAAAKPTSHPLPLTRPPAAAVPVIKLSSQGAAASACPSPSTAPSVLPMPRPLLSAALHLPPAALTLAPASWGLPPTAWALPPAPWQLPVTPWALPMEACEAAAKPAATSHAPAALVQALLASHTGSQPVAFKAAETAASGMLKAARATAAATASAAAATAQAVTALQASCAAQLAAAATRAAAAEAEWMLEHVELELLSVKLVSAKEPRGIMHLGVKGAPNDAQQRFLPICIGEAETKALMRHVAARSKGLAAAGGGNTGGRPMAYELLASTVAACGGRIARVDVSDFVGTTYYARVHMASGAAAGGGGVGRGGVDPTAASPPSVEVTTDVGFEAVTQEVDARPSDAVNLAVRAGAPMYARRHVVDRMARVL